LGRCYVRNPRIAVLLVAAAIAAVAAVGGWRAKAVIADDDETIAIRDDCAPDDPAWAPTGGCLRVSGDVNLAEFNAELTSPLSGAVIGHQGWRNDPSYLEIETDEGVNAINKGGRVHTFTEVADFGGGRVPPLNQGLTPAPACATAVNIPPGESIRIAGLSVGNHRFQCCIHPWMRALIKVEPDD
jgi:hypothetical protein